MGYFELSVDGSDTASDDFHTIQEKIVKYFRKIMKEENCPYNTDGIINCAMIIEEYMIGFMDDYSSPLAVFCKEELIPKLKKYIAKMQNEDFGEEKNKQMHIKKYNQLLKKIKEAAHLE